MRSASRFAAATGCSARRACGHGLPWVHFDALCVSPQSNTRSADEFLQVGVYRCRGGRREVPCGARDQSRRQHVGQRDVFNLRLDRDMFDPPCWTKYGEAAAAASGRRRRVLAHPDRAAEIVPLPVYLETADDHAIRAVMSGSGNAFATTPHQYFQQDWIRGITASGAMAACFCSITTRWRNLPTSRFVPTRIASRRRSGAGVVYDGVVFYRRTEHACSSKIRMRGAVSARRMRLTARRHWLDVQQKLQRGEVPVLQMYPDNCKLVAIRRSRGSASCSTAIGCMHPMNRRNTWQNTGTVKRRMRGDCGTSPRFKHICKSAMTSALVHAVKCGPLINFQSRHDWRAAAAVGL